MKKILSVLLTASMLLAAIITLAVPVAADTASANTFNVNDPSPKISTAEDLQKFYTMCTSEGMTFEGVTVTLEADIVLNDTSAANWAQSANVKKLSPTIQNGAYFMGVFDGKGHTIKGMYIDQGSAHNWFTVSKGFAALFPQTRNAVIKNFTIDGFYVTGDRISAAGAVVGQLSQGCEISGVTLRNGTVKIAQGVEGGNGIYPGVGAIFGYANLNATVTDKGDEMRVFSQTIKLDSCIVEDTVEVIGDSLAPAGGIGGRVYSNTNVSDFVLDVSASKIQPKNNATLKPFGKFTYGGVKYEYGVRNKSWDFGAIIEVVSVSGSDQADYTEVFNNTVIESDCYGADYVEPAKYNVTWSVNNVETSESYYKGATPTYKGDVNIPATDTHIYTFTGWDTKPAPLTANAKYTAQYDIDLKIKVTWMVDNTPIVEYYKHGETPSFTGDTKKADDDYNVYTFKGWDKTPVPAVEDITYIAQYDIIAKYKITWVIDGVEKVETYLEGITPSYKGKVTKKADANNTYEFTGWDKEIVPANGDIVYTAQFKATPKNPSAQTEAPEEKSGCGSMVSFGFASVIAVGMAGAFVARKKKD